MGEIVSEKYRKLKELSDDEFKKVSPFEKQSCYDCNHLISAISWWCGSEAARKYRGTSIPGVICCHFWRPDWKYIDRKYKTKEFGYIPLWKKVWAYFKIK